ncbi:MAG: hypothetical protein IKY70_06105 [Bacteroidales bacterium]|nr:hypothetical protein [Bacteroidales bacterium]
MKQRVVLSTFSIITTLLSIIIFVALIFVNNPPMYIRLSLVAILVMILLAGLYYAPLSIAADKYAIYINRSLRIKTIPMKEVKSVKISPPTMGAIRICGSGGFMGYWGWFKERDLGKYFAYYGRSSDCFIVELKDGSKYMLGCKNAPQMADYIKSLIK